MTIELLFDNVMELCSSALRGTIVAPPGKKLVVADLANIEGRVAAWLAGESWKLDAFRAYDAGTGPDLYKVSYANSFDIPIETVSKDQRQIGKVCLAGGTPVLTDRGYVPIEYVRIADKLWDGVSWVSHSGLVANGVKPVVNVDGIQLTPDHLILTQKTWLPAQQHATSANTLCLALETGSENLPSSVTILGQQEARARFFGLNARAEPSRTKSMITTYDLVSAGPRNRFTILSASGHLIVHNCELMLQYEGGVGAFVTGSLTYGIDLDHMAEAALPSIPADVLAEAQGFYEWTLRKRRSTLGLTRDAFVACDALKRLWRRAHPAISSYWPELKAAFTKAVQTPNIEIPCRKLAFVREKAWLKVRLPSGRYLCYASPQCGENDQLSYMGVNNYTRKWCRIKTYGGKMFEQPTQAVSRDIMFHRQPDVEAAGYQTIIKIHDELVTETPNTSDFTPGVLADIMSRPYDWSDGLPLSAAGFESFRYRKG